MKSNIRIYNFLKNSITDKVITYKITGINNVLKDHIKFLRDEKVVCKQTYKSVLNHLNRFIYSDFYTVKNKVASLKKEILIEGYEILYEQFKSICNRNLSKKLIIFLCTEISYLREIRMLENIHVELLKKDIFLNAAKKIEYDDEHKHLMQKEDLQGPVWPIGDLEARENHIVERLKILKNN